MATRQKRVSQIKRETETTNDVRTQFIEEQAEEDELERAEALLKQKKQMKESPSKVSRPYLFKILAQKVFTQHEAKQSI